MIVAFPLPTNISLSAFIETTVKSLDVTTSCKYETAGTESIDNKSESK